MPPLRRAALIFNPRSGKWRARHLVEEVLAVLAEQGFTVEAMATAAPDHATELAAEAARRGSQVVFVLGGDGTIREAAKALVGAGVALAPLPAGTANIVAYALGVPGDPLEAAAACGSLPLREIDVGVCGDELFLMLASAGLDSWVMHRVNERLKSQLGRVGVGLQGIPEWLRYDYRQLELVADGRRFSGTLAAVCNIPYYAGPYRLIPQARFDDRQLELLVFHGEGRAATLSFAVDLLREKHVERDDVEIVPVSHVRFEGPPGTRLQIDGDACRCDLPLEVELASAPLRVLGRRGRRLSGGN